MTPADELRQAANLIRERAHAANTDEARRPYSDQRIDPVPETQWGRMVDNYLGGEIGEHCASWTPAAARSAANVLMTAADSWDALDDYLRPDLLSLARTYLGGTR